MSGQLIIRPSGLALTVACAASLQLQAAAPELPETDEEAEGTAAHVVAMAHAAGNAELWQIGKPFESGGRSWIVDRDMFNGAQLWARTMNDPAGGADLRTEEPVRISRIHPTQCYGTLDGRRYFSTGIGPQGVPVLRIGDYKFGHKFVEVYENWQCMAYAEGVIELLDLNDQNLIVDIVIVQPRSYSREGQVRRWRIPATDLRGYISIAETAANRALLPNPPAQTGEHCLDCKARHICGTLQRSAASIVDYSTQAEAHPLSPDALGSELRVLDDALDRLESRRTGLAAQAEALLRAGGRVPFYEMKVGTSALKWNEGAAPTMLAAMARMMGVDIQKPVEVCTPRQAIDAGLSEAVVTNFATRPPGALKLKRSSTTEADKVFGVVRT